MSKLNVDLLLTELRTILSGDWKLIGSEYLFSMDSAIGQMIVTRQENNKSLIGFINQKYTYDNIKKMKEEIKNNQSYIEKWLSYLFGENEYEILPDYSLIDLQREINDIITRNKIECEFYPLDIFHQAAHGSFIFISVNN